MLTHTFVTAGKAIFTATNTAKQTRLTFKVEASEKLPGQFFGAVMVGSDNESDYRYVGMVDGRTLTLRETRGSKFRAGDAEFQALRLVLDLVAGRRPATDLIRIQHAGRCGRCARTLTVPESIDSGIGPDCAEQMGLTVEKSTKVARRTSRQARMGANLLGETSAAS